MNGTRTFLWSAAFASAAMAASAQEMTDEELLQVFQAQRDAFSAAQSSGNGKTRGLKLVTVDDLSEPQAPAVDVTGGLAAPQQDTGAVVTGGGGSAVASNQPGGLATPGGAVTPVVYGQLDSNRQVNVRVVFDFDSAALDPSQKPKLAQLCSVMSQSDIKVFRIVGHTDASGSDDYNERLSLLRAQEVKRYFTDECGMAETRLEAIGLGERFLFNSGDPDAGENRRVEFQALS